MSVRSKFVAVAIGLLVVAMGGAAALTGALPDQPGSAAGGYCETLRQVLDPAPAESSSQARFERVDALTAQLVDPAPDKIRADVKIYAAGVHSFVADLAKVDYDFAKVTPEQMQTMQSPELTRAAAVVMESARTDCQISTQPPPAPTG